MGKIFNEDFKEFIELLNSYKVKYILVGGYSVILHGYPRSTGDMNIWVEQSLENYSKLKIVFSLFGMPIMEEKNFLHNEIDVFTYGRQPLAIDILTQCKGLNFNDTLIDSSLIEIEDLKVNLISYNHLIHAKKATGRHKDLNDLEHILNSK